MRNLIIILAIAFSFMACEKPAGEGGTSVIEGQVYKTHTIFNDSTGEIEDVLYYQLDAGKDVFIIYSNNEGDVYDDKFETDYNGKYRFEYLRKGNYTIYTYADSMQTYNDGDLVDALLKYDYPILRHITISSNNSANKVDDFVIEKNQ